MIRVDKVYDISVVSIDEEKRVYQRVFKIRSPYYSGVRFMEVFMKSDKVFDSKPN